jgi:CRISPR type III-B/RAMP module RAMP protein Cmr1
MKKEYNLKFITPCFCGGADGETAELRVPSIRGALRWWFRLLGGSKDEEVNMFGGIAKDDQGRKSCLVLRIKNIQTGDSCALSENNSFFAGRLKTALNAGTTFTLTVHFNSLSSRLSVRERKLIEDSLECFSILGALGSRANRGCGALAPVAGITIDKLYALNILTDNFIILFNQDKSFGSATECVKYLEETTKLLRQKLHSDAQQVDAFGGIKPQRQSSGYKFKPIELADGFLPLIFYSDKFLAPDIISVKQHLLDMTEWN